MNPEEAKEYAKTNLEAYLNAKGINTSSNFSCLNPAHEDKHPSMSFDSRRKIMTFLMLLPLIQDYQARSFLIMYIAFITSVLIMTIQKVKLLQNPFLSQNQKLM